MLSLLKNNPLSPVFRCEELKIRLIRLGTKSCWRTEKERPIRLRKKKCFKPPNKIRIGVEMIGSLWPGEQPRPPRRTPPLLTSRTWRTNLGSAKWRITQKKGEVSVENRNNMNTCCFQMTPPAVIIRPRKRILLHQGGRTAVFLRIAMS